MKNYNAEPTATWHRLCSVNRIDTVLCQKLYNPYTIIAAFFHTPDYGNCYATINKVISKLLRPLCCAIERFNDSKKAGEEDK